jgi:hypothetical protein
MPPHRIGSLERDAAMLESLNAWIESVRFAREVQGVIAMRLVRLAQGGPQAVLEAQQMVAEKLDAFTDAEVALLRAVADGEMPAIAVERAYALVRERVHANSCRLARAAA